MASRKLQDLSPSFLPLAQKFLSLLVEARVPVMIVCTRRTHEEHLANVAAGTSWNKRSRHEDGEAIDLVVVKRFPPLKNEDLDWSDGPLYSKIGEIAKKCGLTWGGTWRTHRDVGHVEMVRKTPPENISQ